MADDLVAELILRLQNEMSGGIDELKAEFDGLDGTINEMRGVLDELSGAIAALQPPAALTDGMAGVVGETDDAITAMQNLGAAIDEDAAKIQALKDAYAGDWTTLGGAAPGSPGGGPVGPRDVQDAMDAYYAGATGGGEGGGGPPRPGPPEPNPDEPPRPGGGGFYHGAGDVGTHLMMAGVESSLADEAAKSYAEFTAILTKTAIKEGLSGDAAKAEVDRLSSTLDSLALNTGNSSSDLAEAYYFLVTTGMNKALIGALMPSLAQDATAYGIPVTEDAQNLYSLNGVLGIGPGQMQQALSVLSEAAQLGHFGIPDFDTYLPGIAAQLSILKDAGIPGEIQASAALEATRKVSGTSEQDAIDLQDLIAYLASPMAARYFDRTKRSQDLLGAPILDLFKKYHIEGINIPEYLDKKEGDGEGTFDAMMDLANLIFTELPKNASGSDVREVFGALFHNQQAAAAALGIAENYDTFKGDESTLGGVTPAKVQTDFQTAINAPLAQVNIVNEQYAELERALGKDAIPALTSLGTAADIALKGLNLIGDWYTEFFANPVGKFIGTGAAYAAHETSEFPDSIIRPRFGGVVPMELHVIVSPSGQVNVTPRNVPAGTSVKVNQGQVLGTP